MRAYRNAARTVSSMTRNVSEMTESSLAELSGIGKDLAGKIREIAQALVQKELVEDIADRYTLSKADIQPLEGFSDKSAAKEDFEERLKQQES